MSRFSTTEPSPSEPRSVMAIKELVPFSGISPVGRRVTPAPKQAENFQREVEVDVIVNQLGSALASAVAPLIAIEAALREAQPDPLPQPRLAEVAPTDPAVDPGNWWLKPATQTPSAGPSASM